MTYREFYKTYSNQAEQLGKENTAVKNLILEICSVNATEFYLRYDHEIPVDCYNQLKKAIDLYLVNNQPIQYIIGYTYFYGLRLNVNKYTLIPRYETELLVEEVLRNIKDTSNPKIIDVGCGSGAIALALKYARKDAYLTAVDISYEALKVAKENANSHALDIEFIESNLFEKVNMKYDVIVSNPPYLDCKDEIESIVYENEPHAALFAKNQGLYFYEEILKSKHILNSPGLIAFEIPHNKDNELMKLVEKYYINKESRIIKDLNQRSRILIIKNL